MFANSLSVLRILLGPPTIYSIYRSSGESDAAFFNSLTLVFLFLAAATDLFDGYAARRLGQISRLGKILDPIADKLFIGGVCAALVWWKGFPLWLLASQVARDVAIVVSGAVLLRKHHMVISASQLGKYATVSMALTMLFHVIEVDAPAKSVMIWITTALLGASTAGYGRSVFKSDVVEGESATGDRAPTENGA